MRIKEIFNLEKDTQNIEVEGWIVFNRNTNKIAFINIHDGSSFNNLQLVIKNNLSNFSEISKLRIGASIKCIGNIKLTPNSKQSLEMQINKLTLVQNTDEDFPLQKKSISLEKLREIPYLRHRTKLFNVVMRMRSTISLSMHEFFNNNGFTYVQAPIITSNDGEGSGESFIVNDEGEKYFFNKQATLGVTGQLHAEALAVGLKNVYTFAPTFRAEKSHTKRHAAEFWMLEPEVAFCDLNGIIKIAYNSLKFTIMKVLELHTDDLKYLEKYNNVPLMTRLNNLLNEDLFVINYDDVIQILKSANKKNKLLFENNDIFFGMDLATEHEKFLTDVHFKKPIAVTNYPKEIKAFYMYQNADKKTVACFDLLVPGVGEMIGGSQREDRYDNLILRMNELKMKIEDYKWYVDLRRFGYAGSAGYGLGLERLIMYITGMDNIRDVLSFPRTPGNIFA